MNFGHYRTRSILSAANGDCLLSTQFATATAAFREIERSIPGITTRMLSKELKEMEMSKLVKRNVYADTPVLVEYEPTEHCRSFGKVIQEMINWGKSHREVVVNDKS